MNNNWLKYLLLLVIVISSSRYAVAQPAGSNDHIFAAAAAAKPYIDFDAKGFLINGKRTFLVSAGMEYARVPRALWYDRLLRLKHAGFNCIEMYTFWNFHEPKEGQFQFSGDHDLDHFLKLINQLGMYAIVRVGPYYCAEWDFGGYPLWLKFKPGLRVREPNALFGKYVDRFFDHLLPIVTSNQVNKGGSVIMVQLENEHVLGWGTSMPNEYFHHLQNKALAMGIQVPYFFSGLHHSSDPAGDTSLDDAQRPNPWLSTEFWSVWYNLYGSTIKDAKAYERRTFKIIAHGGNGYNYYMAYGGSNFGYTNNDEDAASYDYGAAVGQAGDLRPIYYSFKRAAYFAKSFQSILENSTDATARYQQVCADTAVHVTARQSSLGNLVFLDNPGNHAIATKISMPGNDKQLTDKIMLAPGEIFPVVQDYPLNDEVKIEWSAVHILGIQKQAGITTVIAYGEPASLASLYFTTKSKALPVSADKAMQIEDGEVTIKTIISDARQPQEYRFSTGKEKIRVLIVNTALTDRMWLIDNIGKSYILCGPLYAGKLVDTNTKIKVEIETPLADTAHYPYILFTEKGKQLLSEKLANSNLHDTLIIPGNWHINDASKASMPGFDDHRWKLTETPLQMGADGDLSPNAWYRTNLDIKASGGYLLQAEGGDRASIFIDGKLTATAALKDGETPLQLAKGKHTLAIFIAHDGRDKLAGYIGPVDSVNMKGLAGHILLKNDSTLMHTLSDWRWLKMQGPEDAQKPVPKANAEWKAYNIGDDAFAGKEGYGWFENMIEKPSRKISKMVLKFKSVDEDATIFINGRQLAKQVGWNQPFNVTIDHLDAMQWPIKLDVFIENHSNEGGIDQPVRVNTIADDDVAVTGWRMRGGTGAADTLNQWKALPSLFEPGKPFFFKAVFDAPGYNLTGAHLIWRVNTTGLGHGTVWVNGHNLGRYPEKTPAKGLYIPECWMNKGNNFLMIYDEDGMRPDKINISLEKAASRIQSLLLSEQE